MITRPFSGASVSYSCPICMEDDISDEDKSTMVITACNHAFHETCLTNWISKSESDNRVCPSCRDEPTPFTRLPGVEEDPEDSFHPNIESSLVKAVRLNEIETVMKELKLTPLEAASPDTQQPLSKEVRDARAVGFTLQYRDVTNNSWTSLLAIAARHGHKEMVLRMFEAGANINAPDSNGSTPLMCALHKGHESLAKTLIGLGADVHARNKKGVTPAILAAKTCSVNLLEQLMENGADSKATDNDGFGMLHSAAYFGNVEVISYLCTSQLNINGLTREKGLAPLHYSVFECHLLAAEELLKLKANPNLASTHKKLTPLHEAAFSENINMCRLLLDYHADINAKSKSGVTPLMIAAQKGYFDVVKFLLDRGADKSIKRWLGLSLYSAADLAYQNGNITLFELLKDS